MEVAQLVKWNGRGESLDQPLPPPPAESPPPTAVPSQGRSKSCCCGGDSLLEVDYEFSTAHKIRQLGSRRPRVNNSPKNDQLSRLAGTSPLLAELTMTCGLRH